VRRAAWALAAAALVGCATAPLPRVPGEPPPAVKDAAAEDAYQQTLERHSQAMGVYDNLDTRVFFRATWQAPAFVEARVRREALFKAMPADEQAARLEAERARLADATEFFVAVHANEYRYDDLDKRDSMWRVVLVAGGQETKAVSIERLGRTNTELRSYYSYLESFWVGYRVRFPRRDFAPGERFTLKLASAVGLAELPFTAD
jgi:hypothetical protein